MKFLLASGRAEACTAWAGLWQWQLAGSDVPSWGTCCFWLLKELQSVKKCFRHFSLVGGTHMNIKDSSVLLCRKTFKSDLNSALLSPCVAFCPSPYCSSGYFPSLSSSDLTVLLFFFYFFLFGFPLLPLHLVRATLRLLLSRGNMIKSSEDSFWRRDSRSQTMRV